MAQPSIPGTDVGRPVMPYGSDGSDWIALLVDALGRLQVDATIDNVPADLATQTTLAVIETLIGALTNPATGSMNKQLFQLVTRMGAVVSPGVGTLLYQLDEIDDAIGSIDGGDAGTLLGYLKDIKTAVESTGLVRGDIVRTYREGALASGAGWTTVVDITAKGVLIDCNISSNYNAMEFRFTIDGAGFSFPLRDGAGLTTPGPDHLNDIGGEETYIEALLYDTGNDYYVMFLKREIHYDTSLKMEVRQQSGVSKNITVDLHYQPIS